MHTVESLQRFEQEIADIYVTGSIRHPVHLRSSIDGNYERSMISALQGIRKNDWFFGYWDSHIACLLKGVPEQTLKDAIVRGDSIALCFPEYRVFCSGIVGSLMGVATGVAWTIRQANRDKQERVYLYSGDMSYRTGIWHESYTYAKNQELPIDFIVGDNGISVMTDTRKSWGLCGENEENVYFQNTRLYYFNYTNKWPHSGLKERIKF